jgi:hypothetical protein
MYKLQATAAAGALNFGDYEAESLWHKCKHVASESLDQCFEGSWVFARSVIDGVSGPLKVHLFVLNPIRSPQSLGEFQKSYPESPTNLLWLWSKFFKGFLTGIQFTECQYLCAGTQRLPS